MLRSMIVLTSLFVAGFCLPGAARADDENTAAGTLDITGIGATPAKAGETTRITFTIENDGSESANISGLALATGERSRVLGFLGGLANSEIGSIPLKPGQRLELGPRTAWIEVGPLKADLKPGQLVPAELALGSYRLPLTVHVTAPENLATGSLRTTK